MTMFCSARIFSRSAIQASRVMLSLTSASSRESSPARKRNGLCFCPRRDLSESGGLASQLDRSGVDHIELGATQANVGANLPCQQRMLVRRVIADKQDRGRGQYVAHRRGFSRLTMQSRGQSGVVGGPVVIHVVRFEHRRGQTSTEDNSLRWSCGLIRSRQRHLPPSWSRTSRKRLPISSNASSHVAGVSLPSLRISGCVRRSAMMREVKGVASLHAEKVVIDAALVAVVAADDLHAGIGAAHA